MIALGLLAGFALYAAACYWIRPVAGSVHPTAKEFEQAHKR